MARTIAVDGGQKVKRGNVYHIPVSQIDVVPEMNGRYFVNKENVEELAENIAAEGQLQPVTVRMLPNKRAQLVFGFRRLKAFQTLAQKAKAKGEPEPLVRCEVATEDLDDKQAFVKNVCENAQRKRTSCIEDAKNIHRLRDMGLMDQEIAKLYGKDPSWVSVHNRLLTLSPAEQKRIHEDEIPFNAAIKIAQVEGEEKREEVIERAKEIAAKDRATQGVANGNGNGGGGGAGAGRGGARNISKSGVTRDSVERAIRDTKARGDDAEARPKARTLREVRDFFASLDGPGEEEVVVAFAKEVLKYFDGRYTDRQFQNRIEKALGVKG